MTKWIRQKNDFTDGEIREFQRDADRFGRIFIKLLGAEAVGDCKVVI